MQEALVLGQVLEVGVVENKRGGGIEGREVGIAAFARTVGFQRRRERRIDAGVVVDSGPKCCAPRLAYCMRS